jgi:hypothetical protein
MGLHLLRYGHALALVGALVSTTTLTARAQEAPSVPPAPAAVETPLAGYHDGLFYLRDRTDAFRLYVQGRVHVDFNGWLGPGVSSLDASTPLRPTLFLRRVRPEIAGEFFHHWQWQISVDLASSSDDNPAAKVASLNCGVDPTSGAQTCTPQTNPVQAPLQKPAPTDAFVNYIGSSWLNVQVGQFLLPFGMEARISDNTTPFLERALVVRNLAAPFTRDIGAMLWGEAPSKLLYYTVGVYNGDGPNRPNVDNRFDYVAHAILRPFAGGERTILSDAQVGISGKYGSRDARLVGYDLPALTTQEGYAFFRPTYKDSLGRTLHIVPSAEQGAVGGDIYVPIDGFELAGEVVYEVVNTRETVDGYQLSSFNERLGALTGWGYYLEGAYWLVGDRHIIGFPSSGKPLHADFTAPEKAPRQGVELLAKVEQLALTYKANSRGGSLDKNTPSGDIRVAAVTFGVNYWATRNVRVGLDYGIYFFPDSEPTSAGTAGGPAQTQSQRAVAPAQNLAKGVDDDARTNSHSVHEISARVGVQF